MQTVVVQHQVMKCRKICQKMGDIKVKAVELIGDSGMVVVVVDTACVCFSGIAFAQEGHIFTYHSTFTAIIQMKLH